MMTARSRASLPIVSPSAAALRSHLSAAVEQPPTYSLRTAVDDEPELVIEESGSEVNLSQLGAELSRTDFAGGYVPGLFTDMPIAVSAVRSPSEYMMPDLEERYAGEEMMRQEGILPYGFVYGEGARERQAAQKEWQERRRQTEGARLCLSDYQLEELRGAVSQLEINAQMNADKDEFEQQLARIEEIVRRREEYNEAERHWYAGTRSRRSQQSPGRMVTAVSSGRLPARKSLDTQNVYTPRQTVAGSGYSTPFVSSVYETPRQREPMVGQKGSNYLAAPLQEMISSTRRYVLSPYDVKLAAAKAYNAKHNVGVIPYDKEEMARPSGSGYLMDR